MDTDCGVDNEIKPREPIRCKECGYRIMYKKRTKRKIEKKKQKLAELRRAREERKNALVDAQRRDGRDTSSTIDKKDLDELVASLVGDRSSTPTTGPESSPEQNTSAVLSSASQAKTLGDASFDSVPPSVERQAPTLTIQDFVIFESIPKEKVVYNKEIQTQESAFDEVEPVPEAGPPVTSKTKEAETTAVPEQVPEAQEPEPLVIRELTDDEKKVIIQSEHFVKFFDKSTKLVERALYDKYDILTDYTLSGDTPTDSNVTKGLKSVCSFFDERWSKNRSVTDVGWSPKYPELILAAYNKNNMAVNEPDGLVLIWNLHLPDRPEFVFHSQSDVMSATFSEFHPNLVIGGTYSGQIVIWDTRSKNLPVLKTPLSAAGHTHPVYSMTMVGTQNAHNIISSSTDGLVCSWQIDMLAQPQEMLELVHPSGSHVKTDEISVTTFGFPANETGTFWVGTEEGNVYQANRYDRAGSKVGINPFDTYVGHHGMVTSLSFHPLSGPIDFSDIFLTSSVDWTVKLWRVKSFSKPSISPQQITPIYSFEESDDYVYDVKWSPVHPALFGCIDGSGKFDIYDLNQEAEVPTASVTVGSGKALNKLEWDREGKKAAIGSSDGHVYIYDIGEISQPKADDWALFQKTLGEMSSQQSSLE
ncbi:hypothetical protein HDU76_012439 [Blyttiomyces sp. JEL0837]|nr:hypothetical protein HDU76_012439 [Blyttiomyces sp. JEL0837]